MSREALDALEAWHTTTLALREAEPWTAEWVRLRMIAQEQRAAYESLVEGTPATKAEAGSTPTRSGSDGSKSRTPSDATQG